MISDVIFGVMLPGLLAGVVLIAAWPPWRHVRPDHGPGRTWVPLALLAALLASFAYVSGWTRLGPAEIWQQITSLQLWQRVVILAIAAAVLGLLAASWKRPRWSTWVVGGLVAGTAALVIRPPANPEHGGLTRLVLAGLVLLVFAALEPLARRRPGPAIPLGLVICFAGASIVIVQTRNAKLSLMTASLSAACGWAFLAGLMTRQMNLARGGVTFCAAMLPALLIVAAWYDYGPVPAASILLCAAAPVLLWWGEAPLVRRRPAWQRTVIGVIPAALAVGIAVALCLSGDDMGNLGY